MAGEMMGSTPTPTQGWYLDPDNASLERYWDGSGWTDQRRTRTTTTDRVVAPKTDGGAVASLVLGILGFTFCPFVASIIALVLSISARKRIKKSQGQLQGDGQATAGFVLGIIGIVFGIFIVAIYAAIGIPVFLNQRSKAWTVQVDSTLKNMAVAEESFRTSHESYTIEISELEAEGLSYSREVVVPEILIADTDRYCLVVSTNDPDIVRYYDSDIGAPSPEPCA